MDFATRQYFREHEDSDVRGFTIVEEASDQVRLAEKWNRSHDTALWCDYWVKKQDLQHRLNEDQCEYVGEVTDEQYAKVLDMVDASEPDEGEAAAPSA